MGTKVAIFVIRSLISLLIGAAHLYFVILCFGFVTTINPLPDLLLSSERWHDFATLLLSVSDFLLHLLLAIPASAALLLLQGQLRRYHLVLISLPVTGFGIQGLWRLSQLQPELGLSYLSYLNALFPTLALALIGLLSLKHFSHIRPRAEKLSL